MNLPWLDPSVIQFPDSSQAFEEPNGLLAAGGELSEKWLIEAYKKGIFPWFNEGDPILWWSPSPRMVLYPYQFHISKSLLKTLRCGNYRVTINTHFNEVVLACAEPRGEVTQEPSTWISPIMIDAYVNLHNNGHAHSIEVWKEDQLVGGLYGIALGEIFFGESMFSKESNCSKIAVAHLVEHLKQWQYKLIDCQVHNDHLSSLGAIEIDRITFERALEQNRKNSKETSTQWIKQEITRISDFWRSNFQKKTT